MLKIFFIVGLGTSFIFSQSLPFSEDFEDGDVSEWQLYRAGEEALQAVNMSTAPAALFNGGSKVGYLQDSDASYSGAAIALVGETTDENYTIDGDVYVYRNHSGGSAYTGLVVYADSSAGYYVKLVADFDGNNRFRLYNNQMDQNFQYTFSYSIDASDVDTSEGWHHMAVKVETLDDGTTEYTCYYDGQNLGSYIDDGDDRVASGQYGVYSFQMDGVDGIAGYYDNIVVTPNPTTIYSEDFEDSDVSEWQLYRMGEEALQAVDMSTAPAALFNGGNKVGYLQDSDASYSGAAIALVGETTDQNYTIDGDVYVYQNHAGGSAYTGLVVYADSSFQGSASHGYYVKLVADFDASNRFRLYNNQMNNSTFQYSFHHSIDASNVDQTEGWHHMAVKVKTLDDGTTEYTAYYDGQNLGSYIDDSVDRVASGQYGAYAFQMDGDGIAGYFDNIVVTPNPTTIYSEDFEDGDVSEWQLYRAGEEALQAVDMSTAPAALFNGGNKVGYLQDSDASYSGAAIALVGETTDQNYTIDGDVYVYQNHAGGSAYTGLVVYADSSAGYYVKLVADFDGDNRFRLYNNQMDQNFQYTFSNSIDASDVDTSEGWHHMAVKVETLDDGTTEYTCYYDGQNLGSYIDDGADRVASGQYGVYSFQMDGVDGIAGYYDNIVVTSSGELAIEPLDNPEILKSFSLNQNYPNPFNPTTTISFDLNQRTNISLDIFNLNGQFIINLISGNYGQKHYSVIWNGKNNRGRVVPAGMYIYTLSNGSERVSQKMLFLK